MIKTKGITLLELLIAISLLVLVIFAGSGIYLSSWQMFRDAQSWAQSLRSAMAAMMQMAKQLQQAAGYDIPGSLVIPGAPPSPTLHFNVYTHPPDFDAGATTTSAYIYDASSHQLRYFPVVGGAFQIVGTHIHGFTPTVTHDPNHGAIVTIEITARDNYDNADNAFTLRSVVEARYASIPTVY